MRITRVDAVHLSRKLRKKQTNTEQQVWSYLRNRKYRGYKFLRQHPFYYDNIHGNSKFFIPDFFCAELKWILELDGLIHDRTDVKEYDETRDKIMTENGYKVIRIRNEEVTNEESFYEILNKFLKPHLDKLRVEFDF